MNGWLAMLHSSGLIDVQAHDEDFGCALCTSRPEPRRKKCFDSRTLVIETSRLFHRASRGSSLISRLARPRFFVSPSFVAFHFFFFSDFSSTLRLATHGNHSLAQQRFALWQRRFGLGFRCFGVLVLVEYKYLLSWEQKVDDGGLVTAHSTSTGCLWNL